MEQSQAPEEHIRQYPKSILDRGYGMVGKYVMQDRELHVIAKAIYSYVCTFGNGAFPGRDKICYDLQINKNTYAKYMKQLVDYGYITVIQSRSGNQKFFRNTYEINLDPQRVLELRAEKVELPEESAPDRSIEETVSHEIGHGEKTAESTRPISWDTVKADTNNTSVNTTNGVVVLNHHDNKTTTSTTTSNSSKAEEEDISIHSREEEPSERRDTSESPRCDQRGNRGCSGRIHSVLSRKTKFFYKAFRWRARCGRGRSNHRARRIWHCREYRTGVSPGIRLHDHLGQVPLPAAARGRRKGEESGRVAASCA